MNSILTSKWTKVAVFASCLVPLGILIREALTGELGANPVEFIEHATGDWTLRFLAITLAITPVRKMLGLPLLVRYRRMLGLFAFFYASLHFSTYLLFDQMLSLGEMWQDVMKRRYITVGFTGFVLLAPLAVTSTAGWIRRLGGRRWRRLHQAIYVTAVAGVIHYYWLVKSDIRQPVLYAGIIGGLLAWRLLVWMGERRREPAPRPVRSKEPTTVASE
jgi:methionine sulfoxide reductase heme-binding subunit